MALGGLVCERNGVIAYDFFLIFGPLFVELT